MTKIFALLCLCFTFFALPARAETASLCKKDEQVFFSCSVKQKHKTVSLCGSQTLSKMEGTLQYRFGTKDKVELEFPDKPDAAQKPFYYGHYFRAQVDRTRVGFRNNDVSYEVFSDDEGDDTPPVHEEGVRIGTDGKQFLCTGKVTDNMSALESVLPCESSDAWDCVGQ